MAFNRQAMRPPSRPPEPDVDQPEGGLDGGAGRLLPGGIEPQRPLGVGRLALDGRSSGLDLSPLRSRTTAAVPGRSRSLCARSIPATTSCLLVEKNRVCCRAKPAHCAIYNDRLYMFSNADDAGRIQQAPGTVRREKVAGSWTIARARSRAMRFWPRIFGPPAPRLVLILPGR